MKNNIIRLFAASAALSFVGVTTVPALALAVIGVSCTPSSSVCDSTNEICGPGGLCVAITGSCFCNCQETSGAKSACNSSCLFLADTDQRSILIQRTSCSAPINTPSCFCYTASSCSEQTASRTATDCTNVCPSSTTNSVFLSQQRDIVIQRTNCTNTNRPPAAAPDQFVGPPAPTPAAAAKLTDPLAGPDGKSLNLNQFIGRLINAALGLSGAIALLMFVWGGVQMLVSGGKKEMISSGKSTLTWAAIGIVVIFTSYTLVNVLINALAGG